MFLGSLFQMLGFTSNAISNFKQNEQVSNINERGKKLIKSLKIKFILYFIFSYILLIFFWFYISMFDAVYRHTQFLLLAGAAIGFAFSMAIPFAIYLIPGFLRIPSLNSPNKNRRWMYNFSKIFTFL